MRNKKIKKMQLKNITAFPAANIVYNKKADWVLIGTYYYHLLNFSRYSFSFLYSSVH